MALDLGRVLSLTFSTFFKNLHRLLLVSLIVFSPVLLSGGLYLALAGPVQTSIPWLLPALDFLLLHHLLSAALIFGVSRELKGEKMTVRGSLHAALSRVGPVVGLGVFRMGTLLIGFALLVFPGVVLLCIWSVAVPALIEEKVGPIAALKRSAKLTAGSRLIIFAVYFILLLAAYVLSSFAMFPLMLLMMRSGPGPAFVFTALMFMLIGRAFLAVLTAVIYHELRVGGEGVGIEQLGSVFE